MDVPEHIKFLILKWRQRKLTESEQAELDAWYDVPLPEVIVIESDNQEQAKSELFMQIQQETVDQQHPAFSLWSISLKIAAAVLVLLASTFFFNQYRRQLARPVFTHILKSEDRIRKIILPDSSIVWLKHDSHFSYPETFAKDSREVILKGEAFFEIAHNKRWPFRIKSGNYTTTVLGTSFNLKTGGKDEDYVISVITGKVEVDRKIADKQSKVFLVSANQVFHAQAGTVELMLPSTKEKEVQELIKGTQYDMAFVKMPVEQIMKRFEEKFDVQFEGYTGEYNSCVITADLTNISLDKSLQILCSSINATYKIDHNKIKLTGGGCF